MEKMYSWVRAVSLIGLIVIMFTACKKSTASPAEEQVMQKTYVLNSVGERGIGSMMVSREQNGSTRVLVSVKEPVMRPYQAPFEITLSSNSMTGAKLQPFNSQYVSETTPLVSGADGMKVSYEVLTKMDGLKLKIVDSQDHLVSVTDLK